MYSVEHNFINAMHTFDRIVTRDGVVACSAMIEVLEMLPAELIVHGYKETDHD